MLDYETAKRLFVYDPESGLLTRRETVHYRARAGDVVGYLSDQGYLRCKYRQRCYPVHRIIWLLQTGSWPRHEVDHIDNDKTNNRWSNLRDVTPSQNMQNARRARCNSLTGFLGVTFHPRTGRYSARIYIKGSLRHLGMASTAEEAHAIYVEAKRKHHEGNTL